MWDLFPSCVSWEKKEKREFPRGQKKRKEQFFITTLTQNTQTRSFFSFLRAPAGERERERESARVCVFLSRRVRVSCVREEEEEEEEKEEKRHALSLSLSLGKI